MRTLSVDLRERILASYDNQEGTRQDIADRYKVSLGMVKKLLQQRRRTGDISPRHHHSGRKPIIVDSHRQRMKKLLAQLDRQPVRATALLRLFFFAAPPVTYALALSGMRFRDYMAGSVLGLTPTLIGLIFFFDAIFNG